jgi:hypothetical protein
MNERCTIQRHYEEWSTAMAAYCIQEQMQIAAHFGDGTRESEVNDVDDCKLVLSLLHQCVIW